MRPLGTSPPVSPISEDPPPREPLSLVVWNPRLDFNPFPEVRIARFRSNIGTNLRGLRIERM